MKNCKLHPEDILVCSANGSSEHIGKFALIHGEIDSYFGGFMGVLRCDKKLLLPEYLFCYMHSNIYEKYIRTKITGTNIINLKGSDFMKFKIHLPSLENQELIINAFSTSRKTISRLIDFVDDINNMKNKILMEALNVQ